MKQFLLLLIMMLLSISVHSQPYLNNEITLQKVEVVNDDFHIILDSIINHEKVNKSYYCDTLFFTIDIDYVYKKNLFSIYIVSNLLFDIFEEEGFNYAYFFYHGHYFFLITDIRKQPICEQSPCEQLFSLTSEFKKFKYTTWNPLYKPKKGEEEQVFSLILPYMLGDMFSHWLYYCFNNKIVNVFAYDYY